MTSKERSRGRHAQASQPAAVKGEEGGDERNGAAHGCRCIEPVARRSRGEQKGQPGSLFSQLNEDAKSGRRRGGERDRFCPPPTSLSLSLSPSLLHLSVSVSFAGKASKTATASFYPLLSLSLSDSTLFPPALSSFSPVSRAVVLYVWPPCVSWSLGPLSLLYLALPDVKKERRERERERDAWSTRERSLSKQRFNDRGSFHGRAFFRGNEFHRRVSSS